MSVDLSLLKADQSALIASLTAAGGTVRGKTVRCPFHDDSTPPGSGSIYERDGKWGYRCHAASCGFHGDLVDVEAKSRGMTVEDLLKEKAGRRPDAGSRSPAPPPPTATKAAGERKPIASLDELIERAKSWVNYKLEGKTAVDRVEEVNQYTCPRTKNADLVTIRLRLANGDKTFVQGHQSPDTGQFYFGRGDGLLPLFNRTRLTDATIVLVVEGEKAVRRVTSLGIPLVATTSPGGAGADKAALCDWSPLAGKTVYLWPDRDDPDKSGRRGGEEHMKAVAKILEGHECDVYWIDPYKLGLTDHGDDVCDYLDARKGTDAGLAIDDVLMAAMPMPGPAEPLRSRLEDYISGKYATAPWPWRQITAESQALRPGTVTLICGDPGATKCLSPWTKLLRHDGTIVVAGQVSVGDKLMGDDSSPRRVRNVVYGRDEMYRIVPVKGEPFTVSGNHILCYVFKTRKKVKGKMTFPGWTYAEETVREFMARPAGFRRQAKLYRVAVEFPEQPVPLDPYFLGVWLGDGVSRWPMVTTADPEIVAACAETAATFGLKASIHRNKNKINGRAVNVRLSGPEGKLNPVTEILRDLSLLRNKHIPQQYLSNSRESRLKLLAGLIDTDGCMGTAKRANAYCCIIQKSKRLADQISFLANSLGFQSVARPITATIKSRGFSGTYYRVSINGDLSVIPTRIPRKKAAPRRQKKDVLHTGFTIESAGRGSFVSIEVDGNHLHLLADCTVVHNSFWLLESLLWWTIEGIQASVYELEEDVGYWLTRCLAIQSECGSITTPEWCRDNADEVRALFNGNRKLMDELARRIIAAPDEAPTYKTLIEWIESRARRGDRIIGVDPLTAVSVTADRYLEDAAFMNQARKVTRDYGCSLVLITHPKKSGKTHAPMDDMAGGAAFPRFAQSVLWIKTHKPPVSAMVRVSGGRGSCVHNRSVIIAKSRNGAGVGSEIAFNFHGDTLRFEEKGLVLDDDGKPDV